MGNEVAIRDLVPAELRREWSEKGYYWNKDIFTLFAYNAASAPSRLAVIDDTHAIDYATLYRVVVNLAGALETSGIRAGDVVAVQLPNSWRSVATELAIVALGAIVLPYPIGRGTRGTLSLLGRSKAVATVVPASYRGEPHARSILELEPELPHLENVFVIDDVVPDTICLAPHFLPTITTGKPAFRPRAIDPNSPSRILVSSGTEADPKMILYSHNALAGGRGAFLAGLRRGMSEMRNLFLVPLGSAFGSSATFVTIACHGDTLILTGDVSPANVLRVIEQHAATHVFVVPTLLDQIMNHPHVHTTDLSSLSVVASGGAHASNATVENCMRLFGGKFVNVYGSADGVNCHTALNDPLEIVMTTAGRQRPEVTTIVAHDEEGRPLPVGVEGELYSRGPMSPMCYFASPELDERYRTKDGWVRTGDYGKVDQHGYVVLRGRKKEVIIRHGYNISPAELERLISDHPAVLHAACFGVPDESKGEIVCVCVVLRNGEARLALEELKEYLVRTHGLEHRKLPDLLYQRHELPISAAGKVHKVVLVEEVIEELRGHRGTSDEAAPGP